MKHYILFVIFFFTLHLLCTADPDPANPDPFNPVAGTVKANPIWEYWIVRVKDHIYDHYDTINSIALPTTLLPVEYKTRRTSWPDGWEESISGPERLVITGSIYGGLPITPRCINGTISTQPGLAGTPAYYPYKIHFTVEMDCDPTTDVVDKKDPGTVWEEPVISVFAAKGNLKDWDTSQSIDYGNPVVHHNEQSRILTMNIEFDLPADYYAIIIFQHGSYTISKNTIGEKHGNIYWKTVKINFALDDEGPDKPNPAPWVCDVSQDDAAIVYHDDTGDEDIYYTNEVTSDESIINGVTFEWIAVEDNGRPIGSGSNESKSDTAGYYLYRKTEEGWNDYFQKTGEGLNNNPVDIINDAAPPTRVTGVFPLDEGEHFLAVKAYDKAGNVSELSGECHVIVDRSGPEEVTSLRLKDPIPVTNKGDYADASSFTLLWDKSDDLPEAYNAGTAGYDDDLPEAYNAGTAGYEVCIIDTSTGTEDTCLADSGNPVLNIQDPASGNYAATVRAYDSLHNQGNWCSEIYFSVDASPPQDVPADTFTVTDCAGKLISSGGVIFNTTLEDIAISFGPASDGIETWQSGVALSKESYRIFEIKNENQLEVPGERINIADGTITVSCPGLAPGNNVFIIHAVDAAGNISTGIKVTINNTELSPVRFPSPCYTYDNGEYHLLWNVPETIPQGATIAFYKVIIKDPADFAPTTEEFAGAPEITEEQTALTGIPQGEDQVAYIQAKDTFKNTSLGVKTFRLPPLSIEPGEPYVLSGDEWWDGVHEIQTTVIVPEGFSLTILPGAEVRISAHNDIRFIIQGSLDIQGGEGTPVRFKADQPLYNAWQGIYITGQADIRYADIRHALRGITATPGSAVMIDNTIFIHNRVGLHSYGESPAVNGSRFEDCQWYGVKEDAAAEYGGKRPVLTRCIFKQNGYDYYHELNRDITMEELNQLPGNSENRRED
jgi:hypothetical protein